VTSRDAAANMDIWLRNEKTDPRFTKEYKGDGGFRGTATDATYIAKRLTKEFGPIGKGWGVKVLSDQIVTGAPIVIKDAIAGHEMIHYVRIQFWWLDEDGEHSTESFGQTPFVTVRDRGKPTAYFFTDSEAPKKSLTDAMTKAASWLGFAADIHMGYFDSPEYRAQRLREEQAAEGKSLPPQAMSSSVEDKAAAWVDHKVREIDAMDIDGDLKPLDDAREASTKALAQGRYDLAGKLDGAVHRFNQRANREIVSQSEKRHDPDPRYDLEGAETATSRQEQKKTLDSRLRS
jgi:hypothetical protein